ncbi:MAG: hypothetical protein KBE65_11070 [Phycisphaerae bacterium]|nr:hypothetical protein [Phycisphaerae bacterium]
MGEDEPFRLPACAEQYIAEVVRQIRYRKRVREEVRQELAAHFEDELRDCADARERQKRAGRLIEGFGDAKLLAVLCRRAKKRCRPLWKKALVRCVQVLGILILYVTICMSPLYLGRATIKMDCLNWLNETARGGREESDNARPYYDKATKLFVEMPECLIESRSRRPGDMNDVEQRSLSDWLAQNASALDTVREGSRRPYCWGCYRSQPIALPQGTPVTSEAMIAGVMGDCMPVLATYRQLAFAVQWQVRYEAFKGEMDAAVDDCFVLARFGGHFLGNGLAIEQLVGMAIERMANDSVLSLLDYPGVDASLLATVQRRWQERLDRLGTGITFDAEKGIWLDRIQRSFTDDGKGDGHALVRGPGYWMYAYQDFWRVLTLRCPTRKEAMADVDAYYSHVNELATEYPWQWSDQDAHVDDSNDAFMEPLMPVMQGARKFRLADLFLKIQSASDRTLADRSWQWRTEGLAVLTVLALHRYQMERGQYPVDLKQLVDDGYLRQVPRDPYSPGSLSYARTDSGFILYSWGRDRKDDGGRRATDADNEVGDTVFWPVSED